MRSRLEYLAARGHRARRWPAGMWAVSAAVLFAGLGGAPATASGITDVIDLRPVPPGELTLKEAVAVALANNRASRSKRAERDIAATGIERAAGAFQPQFNASVLRGDSRQRNTFEEELVRQSLGIYERESTDYAVGVSMLTATGAKLEQKLTLAKFLTNNIDPRRPPGTSDNRAILSVSVTQPLARDAGRSVTEARLNVAKLDTSIAERAAADTDTTVAAETILAYFELAFGKQRVVAAQEKIRSAQRLLAEARSLFEQGRLAQVEMLEVENALARYEASLSEARHAERERENRLRTQLMLARGQGDPWLRLKDALPPVSIKAGSFQESLGTALARRDDFQLRKLQVEREGIQLAYARNQALPRIDLVASYGVNGLNYAMSEASKWSAMRDFPTWSVGLQVSVPIGESRIGKADVTAAKLRRQDALLGLKALETQIANDVDTSFSLRSSVAERWRLWQKVLTREREQLEVERRKFAAGRSDTREVLLREERVINAQLALAEQQMAFGRADVLLQAAQGILLDAYR